MIRHWAISVVGALGLASLAGMAQAQDRMTLDTCKGSWEAAVPMLDAAFRGVSEANPRADEAGWCVIEDVVFGNEYRAYRIETLRWRGTDMRRLIDQGLPPRSLEIEIADARFAPMVAGSEVQSYLLGVQMYRTATDARLSLRWDGVQKALILDSLEIDFPGANRIEASARIDGVDLSDTAAIQMSLGNMGLSDLDLVIETNGLFENTLAMPLGALLLEEDDTPPEVQVRWWIGQVQEIVAQMSDDILPARSKAALVALLDEMPTPSGTLRLNLVLDAPIGAARLMPLMNSFPVQDLSDPRLAAVLEEITLVADWQPASEGTK